MTPQPEPRDISLPQEAIDAAIEATGGRIGHDDVARILKAADKYLGWQHAGRSTVWATERLIRAGGAFDFAEALIALNEAASDLASWLDGYDERTGEVRDPNGDED